MPRTIKETEKKIEKLTVQKETVLNKKNMLIADYDKKLEEAKAKLLAEKSAKLDVIDAELTAVSDKLNNEIKIKTLLMKHEAELRKLLGEDETTE